MNTLQICLKMEGLAFIVLEKEISFIPFTGLRVYDPDSISGGAIIGLVHYDENGYHAQLEKVLEPTNPIEQLNYLTNKGWKTI